MLRVSGNDPSTVMDGVSTTAVGASPPCGYGVFAPPANSPLTPAPASPAYNRPTGQPANRPTGQPANRPTGQPANRPTGVTCARRPAGARKPASSAPAGSPSPPDPRTGRSCARRLSRLLPVLALLLGALVLFAAAPAQAQNTPPSALRNVQWTPGNASVALTWQAPSSWGTGTGGGFQIQHNLDASYLDVGSGHHDQKDRTKTSFTFQASVLYVNREVTNGQPFNVRIRAWTYKSGYDPDNILSTDYLDGPWTTLSVTAGLPAKIADSALTVTPGNAKLSLS